MGGSHYARQWSIDADSAAIPTVDLTAFPATAKAVAQCIQDGLVAAAHDVSDGGLLVTVAEMLIATSGAGQSSVTKDVSDLARLLAQAPAAPALGAELNADPGLLEDYQFAFGESGGRYVLEVRPDDLARVRNVLRDHGAVHSLQVGKITDSSRLVWQKGDLDAKVDDMARAWLGTLDW